MDPSVGTRLGAYEVRALLGEGGMGRVFRAFDTRLQREVAIKVLPESVAGDPDRLMRFEREARTLAALNHPHIAQIYGIEDASASGPGSHQRALVMELVEGNTLAERIAQGRLPVGEAVAIARQIVDALQAAHDAGIIHRDLKPANVKVRPDGTVKVLDFGLAKPDAVRSSAVARDAAALSHSPTFTSPALTMQGVILGTAAYMSPEQARGKPVDNRTDIWAFGCVLYEMLTAQPPFAGETVSDTIAAILGREPSYEQLPLNTPPAIVKLLRRCLARDPRARLHHIADARFELDDTQAGGAGLQSAAPPSNRARSLAAAALTGAVVSALAVYVAMRATAPASAPLLPIHLAVPNIGPHDATNGVLVSPDGRHLVVMGPGGVATLHSFDESPTQPLAAVPLCWSPDSRTLALQRSNGELIKMNMGGAPPISFATAKGGAWGCTWSSSGVLLIDDGRSLYQIGASGGSATPVQLDDDGAADSRRVLPRFLPGGQRFLYWAVNPNGQHAVRAGSLAEPQTRLIVRSDGPSTYADGYLLFQRGTTLVAQPFDAQTLTLSGEPRAVTAETAPGAVIDTAVFDASQTGMLVYKTTNSGVRGHQVWVDRRGAVLGTLPQPSGSELLNLALSPDEMQVVGNRMDPATGNWDIWSLDLRSGIPTRLTTQEGVDSDAVWSPDGTEIAYVSNRVDTPGIYRLSIADRREQLLLKTKIDFGPFGVRTTDWTPDGRFVIYDSGADIFAVPTASAGATPLPLVATPPREVSGTVSPDGRWLAFQTFDAGEMSIHVQPFPGPGTPTRVSVGNGYHAQWRGDSTELFWEGVSPRDAAVTSTVLSVDLTFAGNAVHASPPKLVHPALVSSPLIDNRRHWTVTGDGQRFLLRQADGPPGPAVKVILNWPEKLRRQ